MTSILLAESLLPSQFVYCHLRKGHVARNWGILLANSQLGTEVCSPIMLDKLDFANRPVTLEMDPFSFKPSDETTALDKCLG